MVVYSFFSDGLISFAEVFLTSFKKQHGEDIPILFSTLDLNQQQIEHLHSLYQNLEIYNRSIDFAYYAEITGESEETLRRWKHEVEHVVTTDENFRWKLLMSVEERYRSISTVAKEALANGFKFIFHSDIDMYFRKPLNGMWNIMQDHDVSITFRWSAPQETRVLGALIGFNLTPATMHFLQAWDAEMDRFSIREKPRGYGQTSFYLAYEKVKQLCRWGDLSVLPGAPVMSKCREDHADIWLGNSNSGRNRKQLSAEIFKQDLQAKTLGENVSLGSSDYMEALFPAISASSPSALFRAALDAVPEEITMDAWKNLLTPAHKLIQEYAVNSVADFRIDENSPLQKELSVIDPQTSYEYSSIKNYWGISTVASVTPLKSHTINDRAFEGVVCINLLQFLPAADQPWVINELFRIAANFVLLFIDCNNSKGESKLSSVNPDYWHGMVNAIAAEHPGVDFRLACKTDKCTFSWYQRQRPETTNSLNSHKQAQIA